MKKFFGLLKNELIKILKQTGYRVMLIVIAVLSLLTPLLGLLTTLDFGETPQDEYEMYSEWAETVEDELYRKYYRANAESVLFFIDNGLADSWKYSRFGMEYKNLYIRAVGAQLFESGELTPDNIEKSPFDMYLFERGDRDDPEIRDEETVEPESKYDIPTYADAKAELDAKAAEILAASAQDVAAEYVASQADSVKSAEASLELLKKQHEASPNNAAIEYQLRVSEEQLRVAKLALESYRAIYDNSAEPNGWAYSMHHLLSQCLNNMVSCVPMPEDMYDGEDYDEYLAQCESSYAYYNEAACVYLHSIKTDNCVSPMSDGSMLNGLLGGISLGVSTKSQLRSAIVSSVNFVTILMVVLASGIISTEFSSGTIRLLVIRPCTRRQIMVSKLTAIAVVYAAVVAAMSIILTLETVLIFGVGDLFAPDIVYLAGNAVDLPFFVMTLERIGVASLVALAYIAVAIILASLTRKNGLAITISMLIYAFGSTVTMVVIALVQIFPNAFGWAIYTPLAYMSLVSIMPPAQEMLSAMGGMLFTSSGAKLWLGVLYHLLFVIAMTYLTVLVFRKRQIKN